MTHKHDWKPGYMDASAWGRPAALPIEKCSCGDWRPVGTKRDAMEIKRNAKREALMIARAEKWAREGKTAKQRRQARELLGVPTGDP